MYTKLTDDGDGSILDKDLHLALCQVPIFQGLDPEELDLVAAIARVRTIKRKSIVFIEGGEKDAVYFVLDGIVKTYKTNEEGHEHIVSLLQTGDMFPHTGFFNSEPYPATAETLVDSTFITISVKQFEQLIVTVPAISMKLIDVMGATIRELQQKLQQMSGHDVHERILSFLLQLAEKLGERRGNHIHIELPITNQELASSIGTTRETVNRLLNQLKKQALLHVNRAEIVIIDMEGLRRWSSTR